MSATPLPPPELIFFDAALQSPLEGYTVSQVQAYATQARADLEAENNRLREALLDCKTNARKEDLVKRIVDLALEKQP